MNNTISIIVPVYNIEKYISQCLDTLINQTYSDLQIILIDDGSTDNSPKICDSYAEKDSRVTVIHKENGGVSSARNLGLKAVKGDYLFFIDGDDWLEKDALEQMMDMLKSTDTDAVFCGYYKTDGKDTRIEVQCYRPTGFILDSKDATQAMLLDILGEQACRILFKSYCWKNVQFPVDMIYEDMVATFQAIAATEKITFINKPLYLYRQIFSSLSHKPNPMKSYYIFKAFELHYEYAVEHYPDIANHCCTLAAAYAISTYFHYCSDAKDELAFYKDEIIEFLYKHKNNIDYSKLMKSRKLSLKCFYLSKTLFSLFAKTLKLLGLQKKLNLEVK